MHAVRLFSCFGAVIFAAGSARAQSADVPANANDTVPKKSHWYGWQTLATDGAALSLIMVGTAEGAGDFWERNETAENITRAGAVTYLLGPPVVHVAHGRPLAGLGSLGLRAGAPTIGWFAGAGLGRCPAWDVYGSCSDAIAAGVFLGYATAVTLDAAVLARESAPAERSATARPRVSPGIAVTGKSRALVLAGTF